MNKWILIHVLAVFLSFLCATGVAGERDSLFSPVVPPNPEHQARKHRYLSIDATTNLPFEAAIKVEIAEMNRCQNDLRSSCIDDNVSDLTPLLLTWVKAWPWEGCPLGGLSPGDCP